MEQKMLRKYAEMAVKTGINIQPNQTLVIRCPIHGAEFARECASVAYARISRGADRYDTIYGRHEPGVGLVATLGALRP